MDTTQAPNTWLRTIYTIFFNVEPWLGFLNFLNIVGDFWTSVWSFFGVPIKIVGF